MDPPRSRATSTVTSPECPDRSDGADPGQSGRSGAWTLDDQPGLIHYPISVSSRIRPSAAAADLMSDATALGGIFQRLGDLLRRAPGLPQRTNTVKPPMGQRSPARS